MKREEKIKCINDIISKHGEFSTGEVEAESSPCVFSDYGVCVLLETFYNNVAEAVTYNNYDDEIYNKKVEYTDLEDCIIDDIYELALVWKEIKENEED